MAKKLNIIIGWLVFAIAFITYLSTLEPTLSLWDCGEFLASSYKLEPGHPPGAPFFLLMARLFSLFAMGNVSIVAWCVNAMSAVAAAFTIMFLFWTIVHLACKIKRTKIGEIRASELVLVFGSGVVGALALAFSDTFWFSAVEAEVYAFSSLLTALVFWAILKWENEASSKFGNRWLLFIAYIMGLSIGVHLLNLLAIPAIVMVYYFKLYKTTVKGILIAFLTSVLFLLLMMYGVIQGIVTLAWWFELLIVNGFGLPFNSGVIIFFLLLLFLLVYGIYYSYCTRKYRVNTILLAFTLLLIGYSSYAVVVIRANAGTPINENNPGSIISLLSYLNREQYGDRPLLYGQTYNAPIVDGKNGKANFVKSEKEYQIVSYNIKPVYDDRFTSFFPRMYSPDPNHVRIYKDWAKVKGKKIKFKASDGSAKDLIKPTFIENLRFFVNYQVNHMYLRYFMWNFAGRQNDIQGHGGIWRGNWLSGLNVLDDRRLSPQKMLPKHIKDSPSRNTYFLLPLLLGSIGLYFHFSLHKKDFSAVLLLFFMTGLAIVVYLNQTPLQPRERDYAFAGSFYTFAIWIGLGVLAIGNWVLGKTRFNQKLIIWSVAIGTLIVPAILLAQNYDDHNRSGRYHTLNYAYNSLAGCEPNAILFTYGDNDTFPLWYIQEVEGFRTDVRVVNTTLLNLDWYIDQMKQHAYTSDTLPFKLTTQKYHSGKRDRVYVFEESLDPMNLTDAIDFVASDEPNTKSAKGYKRAIDFLPAKKMYMMADTSIITSIVDSLRKIKFSINRNSIGKSELIILDILANNHWKRPLYFVEMNVPGTSGLEPYLQLEGFNYRLVSSKCNNNIGNTNTEIMYDNMMNKYRWKSMDNTSVWVDNMHERTMLMLKLKYKFILLSKALIAEGKCDSALHVLQKGQQVSMSGYKKDDKYTPAFAEALYLAGDTANANFLISRYFETCKSELKYFFSLDKRLRNKMEYDISNNFVAMNEMGKITSRFNQLDLMKEIVFCFEEYFKKYDSKR